MNNPVEKRFILEVDLSIYGFNHLCTIFEILIDIVSSGNLQVPSSGE